MVQDDRLTFLFSDPNVYGAYLVSAFVLYAALLIKSCETRVQNTKLLAFCFALALLLFAILLTGSRGAYLQGILVMVLFLLLERKNLKAYMFRTIVPIMLFVVVSSYLIMSTVDETSLNRLTASDLPRIENLSFAKELLSERDLHSILIGTGNGSYESFSPDGFSAHNIYLRLIIENGVLGLSLFLFFLFGVGYRIFRHERSIVTHAVFASVIGILVHGLFIDTLHWRHFWLLLGLL
jgi:O-antigen ligase